MAKKQEKIGNTREELQTKYNELSREIYDLVSELRMTKKLEKPHLIRLKKKERARVMTRLNQKGAN